MKKDGNRKLRIGISMGDPNGIGPEVIIKSLIDKRIRDKIIPIVYGSGEALEYYISDLNLAQLDLNRIETVAQAENDKINLIECGTRSFRINPGDYESGGQEAYLTLEKAAIDVQRNETDALVTAPLNKANIAAFKKGFSGHTGFLAEMDNRDALMILVSDEMRITMVTGHIPLSQVSATISAEKIKKTILNFDNALKQDFGIGNPEIAVLGLNPHAGEAGLLGREELDVIAPLMSGLKNNGVNIHGPLPADGFFGMKAYRNFNGIVSMYHDQGLIPFKTLSFEKGVNFTAGLSFIRTSPDHGTAYDLAGKNLASAESMTMSIILAEQIWQRRNGFQSENQ